MADDDELPSEFLEAYRDYAWDRRVRKYTRPDPDSVLDLALRLRIWRTYFDRPRSKSLTSIERELHGIADEFHRKQQRALKEGDRRLLRRIWEASALLEKKVLGKINLPSKALYTLERLEQHLGHPPTQAQVIQQLKKWGVPLGDRQLNRVREALAPLYKRK
jgi:hypothetical protein